MKQCKLILIVFLITSLVFGDKLYLWNGEVYEGKYEGIIDSTPTFTLAEDNSSMVLVPENVKKITDDDGNLIATGEELFFQMRKGTERTFGLVIITVIVVGMVGIILLVSSKKGGTKWKVWSPG